MRSAVALLLLGACGRLGFGERDVVTGDGGVDGSGPVDPNIVFVSSASQPAGSLGGLAGADALCGDLARASGLAGNYVAFLSTTTVDARDRIASASGWVRVDGKPFVNSVADLVAGKVLYPPRLDETTTDYPDGAPYTVTATGPDGLRLLETCADWTDPAPFVGYGFPYSGTGDWVASADTGCGNPTHVYCFGIDRVATVHVPSIAGKRAFVTAAPFAPGGGLASADAQCASDASAAGLAGSFAALLATDGMAPIARFTGPWHRIDGVPWDPSVLETALTVTADGRSVAVTAWTGASAATTAGMGATSCQSWGSSANTNSGGYGDAMRSSGAAFDAGTRTCDIAVEHLYCLEL